MKILTTKKQLSPVTCTGFSAVEGRLENAAQAELAGDNAAMGGLGVGVGWTVLAHREQRWAFDVRQVAKWDAGDQNFSFYAFHGLSAPSAESVADFIDFMGFLDLIRRA